MNEHAFILPCSDNIVCYSKIQVMTTVSDINASCREPSTESQVNSDLDCSFTEIGKHLVDATSSKVGRCIPSKENFQLTAFIDVDRFLTRPTAANNRDLASKSV